MIDDFPDWRRKIGVMTLVLACVLAGRWLRSHICSDQVYFGSAGGKQIYSLRTYCNCLVWEHCESEFDVMGTPGWHLDSGRSQTGDQFRKLGAYLWRRKWYGFDFGEQRFEPLQFRRVFWSVPFWPIVIPLTCLSAFLLLRVRKHGEAVQRNRQNPVRSK